MATTTKSPKQTSRDMRQVVGELKQGYRLRKSGDGHLKVEGPDGRLVRDADGKPVSIANTPSDVRAMKNTRALFKRLGILETNGSTPKRATREHGKKPELAGPNRATQAAEAKERQRKTELLRGEMQPWIRQLGGWEARGLPADLSAIIHHVTPTAFASLSSAQQTVHAFKNGSSLSDTTRAAFYNVHDLFKDAEDVRGVYVDLVRQARGLSVGALPPVKLKPGEEWPFKVELLPLAKLFADDSYQRPVHEAFVRSLVMRFDERLVGVIDVARRSDGRYAILDGQQRTETMREVGKTTCYCAIYEDMAIADEATYFFHKNKDRKGMSAFYGFQARVLAGDESALAIQKMLKAAGFVVAPVTDHDKQIGAVRAVEDVYEMGSEVRDNCLPPTLELIKQCFFGRKGSLDTEILRGAGRFFRAFADEEINFEHWYESLTAFGPLLVIGRARDFSGATEKRHHGRSMAATLLEIHNTGLPSRERLSQKRLD